MILFGNNPQYIPPMTNVSRSFTQADCFHPQDSIGVIMQEFILLCSSPWGGSIYLARELSPYETKDGKVAKLQDPDKNQFVLILYRPLYGTRDAPLRWYRALANRLIARKFVPLKSDCCIFVNIDYYRKARRGSQIPPPTPFHVW